MKDFFKWFKAGTKMKRWLFLMLIGILLVCYGVSKIILTNQLDVMGLAKIVLSFTFGFTFVVVSVVYMQKRTLELLIKETDTRNIGTKNEVSTLIFNKKVYNQGPKIVVIGGGSGLNTVLRGLKNYTDNITAIVTVSDYGDNKIHKNSTSPLDEIKNSLVALSNNEEKMAQLLNAKVGNDGTRDVKFSDVYFDTMKSIIGDFPRSIEESKYIFNMTGKVIPVTLDAVNICAELEDGTIVESKEKIPEVVNDKVSKINRVYLSPTNSRMAPGVQEAIQEADAIVIGPGSLYTNVIPNLLVPGVSRAIRESKAFKVFVSNIMTEVGQTDNYSLSEHIQAIIDHAGKEIIDYCIYDTGEIIPEYIRKYNKEGCDLVEQDVSKVKEMGIKLIQRNLSTVNDGIIKHNQDAIATAIIQLICDDLKFNDMQNDAQFIMLDSKIKDTNKKLQEREKENKKSLENKRTKRNNGKMSKFFEKYKDRVESIKESTDIKQKNQAKISNKIESSSHLIEDDEIINKINSKNVENKPNKKSNISIWKKESKTKEIEKINKNNKNNLKKHMADNKNSNKQKINEKKEDSRKETKKDDEIKDINFSKDLLDKINNMRKGI